MDIDEKLRVLEKLKNSITNEKETNEKDNSVEDLFKYVQNKFDTFENNLLNTKKALSAMDTYIQTLENKIDDFVKLSQEQIE